MNALLGDEDLDVEVAIIGAGFGGIGAGISLQRAGIESFLILERADDLGGTWRDNTYPGVAVDITSLTYSFSFEQNPDWSGIFAPGSELQAYANHCTDRYGLRTHMRFGVTVERAVFDEARDLWELHLGGGEVLKARFIISATGGLTQPKKPDIPGLDDFRGTVMHTARWNHDHELSGKRVAIIGTGASAVQVVPAIAPMVEHLDVYQRTPIWILPRPDAGVPRWLRTLFRRVPATQSSARLVTTSVTELVMVLAVVYHRQAPWVARTLERACRLHLRSQVRSPALRDKLTPQYGFGCKRPSFSNDYLRSFERPNVSLVTDSIERILPDGLRTTIGTQRKVDTLILATGFKVFEKGNLPSYDVFGREGAELGAFWREQRYQAYEGCTVPGFPNFFLVLGPYSFSGSSWFAMVEAQTTHATRCIREAHRRRASRVEVRQKPHDEYFADILRRQQDTVFFNNRCQSANSYYFDPHGDAPFIRPSMGVEMWWRSSHFDLQDYRYSGAERT